MKFIKLPDGCRANHIAVVLYLQTMEVGEVVAKRFFKRSDSKEKEKEEEPAKEEEGEKKEDAPAETEEKTE